MADEQQTDMMRDGRTFKLSVTDEYTGEEWIAIVDRRELQAIKDTMLRYNIYTLNLPPHPTPDQYNEVYSRLVGKQKQKVLFKGEGGFHSAIMSSNQGDKQFNFDAETYAYQVLGAKLKKPEGGYSDAPVHFLANAPKYPEKILFLPKPDEGEETEHRIIDGAGVSLFCSCGEEIDNSTGSGGEKHLDRSYDERK